MTQHKSCFIHDLLNKFKIKKLYSILPGKGISLLVIFPFFLFGKSTVSFRLLREECSPRPLRHALMGELILKKGTKYRQKKNRIKKNYEISTDTINWYGVTGITVKCYKDAHTHIYVFVCASVISRVKTNTVALVIISWLASCIHAINFFNFSDLHLFWRRGAFS